MQQLKANRFIIFFRNLYRNTGKISINKNCRKIQAEIKTCKHYEFNNFMDASVLSVETKGKPPQKYWPPSV